MYPSAITTKRESQSPKVVTVELAQYLGLPINTGRKRERMKPD